MTEKHNIEVLLVVVCPSVQKRGDNRVLLLERNGESSLPCKALDEQEGSLLVASSLLKYHTGIKARILGVGWIDLVPCPLADNIDRLKDGQRVIAVTYGCMLPGELVKLTDVDAKWVPIIELANLKMPMDHYEIILSVCNRI